MDLGLFFGRFHPLVVHLPIGFLLLAAILEGLSRFEKYKQLKPTVSWALLLGALSAIISIIFGFLISGDRGYDDEVLSFHKWLGISVALLSIVLWLMEQRILRVPGKIVSGLFIVLIIVLSLTGHLGGTLTHGEGYLVEYAPGFIKKIAGASEISMSPLDRVPVNPDSVAVFADMVYPILEMKCMPCHNETQAKGGLVLTDYEKMMEGGDSEAAVSAGKPFNSELFRRITLPVNHKKFMPLKKQPLAYTEVNLIKWWIETGAKTDHRLSQAEIPDYLSELLMRDHKIDVTPKPYYEQIAAPELDPQQLQQFENSAFNIRKLSAKNNFLDVSVTQDTERVTLEDLEMLLNLKDNITWLDLKGKLADPKSIGSISELPHLTRLNIADNQVKDEDLQPLTSLKHLESLNLVGTTITNDALGELSKIPTLKRLFVWQTGVTSDAVDQMMENNKSINVVIGYQFPTENN